MTNSLYREAMIGQWKLNLLNDQRAVDAVTAMERTLVDIVERLGIKGIAPKVSIVIGKYYQPHFHVNLFVPSWESLWGKEGVERYIWEECDPKSINFQIYDINSEPTLKGSQRFERHSVTGSLALEVRLQKEDTQFLKSLGKVEVNSDIYTSASVVCKL